MTDLGTRLLTTPRLVLRRFTIDDVDAIFEGWASDPAVTVATDWETHPDRDVTRATVQMWVEQYASDGTYHWAILYRDAVVGAIAVVDGRSRHAYAEIGYALSRRRWNLGIMTEALGAVTDYLLGEVGLNRLVLMHDADNPASGRVMRKNGYMHEGVLREQRRRKDGTFGDLHVYGLLRRQWLARRSAAQIDGKEQRP